MSERFDRRKFLASTAALATVGIAGCSSTGAQSDPTPTSSPAGTPTDTPTDTPTETASPTPTETQGPIETASNSREQYARPGTLLDDFEDLTNWTAFEGQMSASDTAAAGSQSAHLVGEDGNGARIELATDEIDLTNTEVSVAVRTPTPGRIAVNIRLGDPFGNWRILSLRQISQSDTDIAWFRTAPGTYVPAGDAFDPSQISRVQVHMLNATAQDAELFVDDLRTHPKPDTGYIVLSWDDNRSNYYEEAAPINDSFGYNVSMATAPRLVGGNNFMSVADLTERKDAGDEIVAHASVSLDFNDMDAEKLDQRLRQNKKWLVNQGFEGADTIVYPGNNYDQTVLSTVANYHVAGGMNQAGNVNTTGVYSFDPLVLPRTIAHDLSISKRVVDNVAENHEAGILNFHDFGLRNTMGRSDYEELLQHIESKGNALEVITLGELWELRTQS